MSMEEWHDSDLIGALREVDAGPEEVDDWEANFIEKVLAPKRTGRLTMAQRNKIIELADKYLGW